MPSSSSPIHVTNLDLNAKISTRLGSAKHGPFRISKESLIRNGGLLGTVGMPVVLYEKSRISSEYIAIRKVVWLYSPRLHLPR